MVSTKYNGYTNYETWLIVLNLDNDQSIQRDTIELAQETDYNEFKETIEEWFHIPEYDIYKIEDVWTQRDWEEANWYEVHKDFKDRME